MYAICLDNDKRPVSPVIRHEIQTSDGNKTASLRYIHSTTCKGGGGGQNIIGKK